MWQIFFSSFSAWQHLHLKHSLNINEKETFLRGDHQISNNQTLKIAGLDENIHIFTGWSSNIAQDILSGRIIRQSSFTWIASHHHFRKLQIIKNYKTIKLHHLNSKPPSGSQEGGNSQAIGRSWNKSWSCYFFVLLSFTFEFIINTLKSGEIFCVLN